MSKKPTVFNYADYEKALERIKELEARLPRWIPTFEKSPETEDKVLCCTATKTWKKNLVIGYYIKDFQDGHGRWCSGMNSNVIAWMPLPELPSWELFRLPAKECGTCEYFTYYAGNNHEGQCELTAQTASEDEYCERFVERKIGS